MTYDLAPALIGTAVLIAFALIGLYGERICRWIHRQRLAANNHARGNQ
jgi:hypothetical protein